MQPPDAPAGAYLDNNATTPVAEEVLAAMLPWFRQRPGNPSSLHGPGEEAFAAISTARTEVAKLVGAAHPSEVTFTGSATEATNTAIAAALARTPARTRVITSSVEHAATLEGLASRGVATTHVPVDRSGALDEEAALAAIAAAPDELALVTLLFVNNETGRIQDTAALGRIAEAAHTAGALVHLDVVQAAGKLPLDLGTLGADLASLSAHKLHGPKGVGALWVKSGTFETFPRLVAGGPQENERRAGTENVPGIVGFGRAAALAVEQAADPAAMARIAGLRDHLEAALLAELEDLEVVAAGTPRVTSTSCIEFHGIDGEAALLMLSQYNIQVSTGSACGSSHHGPSHVLLAMGRSEAEASSSLRFSLSRETSTTEIEHAIATLPGVIRTLRTLAGLST